MPNINEQRQCQRRGNLYVFIFGFLYNRLMFLFKIVSFIPTRYVVVFVAALGKFTGKKPFVQLFKLLLFIKNGTANTISYIMRTNMSVTIVAMVNHTQAANFSSNDTCPVNGIGHSDDAPLVSLKRGLHLTDHCVCLDW